MREPTSVPSDTAIGRGGQPVSARVAINIWTDPAARPGTEKKAKTTMPNGAGWASAPSAARTRDRRLGVVRDPERPPVAAGGGLQRGAELRPQCPRAREPRLGRDVVDRQVRGFEQLSRPAQPGLEELLGAGSGLGLEAADQRPGAQPGMGGQVAQAQRLVKIDLAEWTWAVMERGMPYVVCDTDGAPVTLEEAKAIIAEHWTVPEDVRRRRRSKKGKAPHQVLVGHAQLGPRGAATRRPSPRPSSARRGPLVKTPA